MNKRLVLISTVLAITVILVSLSIPFADSYIPPTRAFFRIFSGSGNVTAQSSMGEVTFIAGTNMTITPNYNTSSITFSSTSGGIGSGDNLGNHIATQDLNMNTFNVTNTQDVSAVTITTGSQIVYRCTTAGVLPVDVLTINNALCLTSADTGLRVN